MGSNKKGFTLLELLIYTALLAAMAVVVVNVFLGLTRARGGITARTEVNSNLRFALEKINQDISASSSITTPSALGGAGTSTLVVNVGGTEGTVTYCVTSGVLRRQPSGGACDSNSPRVTSDKVNVTVLNFIRFENTTNISAFATQITAVSIQTSITIAYASTSPNLNYSTSQTTIQSPL